MTRDWESLKAAVAAGAQPKYIFFWGHRPPKDGSIGKSCFSQWWPSAFEIEGVTYASAEHYMMAEKARLFGDEASFRAILQAASPAEAKKLGAQVSGFVEASWLQHRFDIVVRGNQARFTQNAELGDFLRKTGDRVLVEASPLDRIWGIGLAEEDPRCLDPVQWQGLNLLGFALMEVRAQL